MALGAQIRKHRTDAALTLEALAEKSGVDVGTISALEVRDSSRSKYAPAIARALGLTVETLLGNTASTEVREASVAYRTAPSRGVPLISWVQAGTWSEIADPYAVGDAEEWLPCPVRHGPRTYCLRVRGDSMDNPTGRPSYADGDIIFVDPDKEPRTSDRVIVRFDDQQEGTFKQLLVEDGRKMLKALNPEWKPRYVEINGNATVTGVVIGKWVPE